jgi:ABC-type transport system involved in cytochrome bd biosynthesis fused ATPase/permease subunit
MIALVGRSGSGKSTLANLIPRFYHHEQGQILLDGVDVEDYTLRNLRRHIALVTQQVSLFNDTIANNIAYGDLAGLPRERIEEAAGQPMPRNSLTACRRATTRWLARTAYCSPAASASAWPSPAPSSRMHRC